MWSIKKLTQSAIEFNKKVPVFEAGKYKTISQKHLSSLAVNKKTGKVMFPAGYSYNINLNNDKVPFKAISLIGGEQPTIFTNPLDVPVNSNFSGFIAKGPVRSRDMCDFKKGEFANIFKGENEISFSDCLFKGEVVANNDISINGACTFAERLSVKNGCNISGQTNIFNSEVVLLDNAKIEGRHIFNSDFTAGNNANIIKTLFKKEASIGGGATIDGVKFDADAYIGENSTIKGSTYFSKSVELTNSNISTGVYFSALKSNDQNIFNLCKINEVYLPNNSILNNSNITGGGLGEFSEINKSVVSNAKVFANSMLSESTFDNCELHSPHICGEYGKVVFSNVAIKRSASTLDSYVMELDGANDSNTCVDLKGANTTEINITILNNENVNLESIPLPANEHVTVTIKDSSISGNLLSDDFKGVLVFENVEFNGVSIEQLNTREGVILNNCTSSQEIEQGIEIGVPVTQVQTTANIITKVVNEGLNDGQSFDDFEVESSSNVYDAMDNVDFNNGSGNISMAEFEAYNNPGAEHSHVEPPTNEKELKEELNTSGQKIEQAKPKIVQPESKNVNEDVENNGGLPKLVDEIQIAFNNSEKIDKKFETAQKAKNEMDEVSSSLGFGSDMNV